MTSKALISSLFYPSEIYSLIKFKLTVKEDSTINKTEPSLSLFKSKHDPNYTYAMCYYFLNLTSRSFARVIQELDQELRHPVCLFYLILRGLDTIEDDMTIPIDKKTQVLHEFHELIYKKGWHFTGNGPQEKDRDLLVRFDLVIEEFLRLDVKYQKAIADITRRMGKGMADYRQPNKRVQSIQDYNLYTHYVAGLVGIGLTDLFVASGLEKSELKNVSELPTEHEPRIVGEGGKLGKDLANRMGLFLQKVNIMKDYLEDLEEGRVFWPEEIWNLYAPNSEKDDISVFSKPENLDRAVACLNHLCADALTLVPDCLEYMSMIKCKTVFQFCAIPQMMAIASIALFFNNSSIFKSKGIKIRRGLAVKLILESSDIESVKKTYQHYILDLHRQNRRAVNGGNQYDKSFMKIATAVGKIQAWINDHTIENLPGQSRLGQKPYYLKVVNSSPIVPYLTAIIVVCIGLALNWFSLSIVKANN